MIQHSENFFPAECGELLALLVKYYKDNPAVKGDKELKGVTAQNIYTFYKEMMEDIDKLPEEIKNMDGVINALDKIGRASPKRRRTSTRSSKAPSATGRSTSG